MPAKATVERAKQDLREGKSPTTAAGEFVHEEIEHGRRGKHGARPPQQAIAIGLSKAGRAGVPLPPPAPGKAKESTSRSAERDYRKGQAGATRPARKYFQIREEVLKREPRGTVSRTALSRQARRAASRRSRRTKKTPPGQRVRELRPLELQNLDRGENTESWTYVLITEITREELRHKLDHPKKSVLLEALPPEDYRKSHLPGALNMPPDQVRALASELIPRNDLEVIVYCSGPAFDASERVAQQLVAMGHSNIRLYVGGKQDWIEAGLPMVEEKPTAA